MTQGRTKKQHVLPGRSIQRFCTSGKHVYVKRRVNNIFSVPPHDQIFCAYLKWGEDMESGIKKVEDDYQALADRIVDGYRSLEPSEHAILNQFFALISQRSRVRYLDYRDSESIFDHTTVNYNENLDELKQANEEREQSFSSRGPEDKSTDRAAASFAILMGLTQAADSKDTWGIVTTRDRFVGSDTYHVHSIIPVSPTIYLARNGRDELLDKDDTAMTNRLIVFNARSYVFSDDRDLLEGLPNPAD